MPKTKASEAPPAPKLSLFEVLDALRPALAEETQPGIHPDVVRLALTNVVGAIDHVDSAVKQADPLWRRNA